jgi:uncharacterized protein YwgA
MGTSPELHGEEAARKQARSRLDELVLYVCSRVERPADLGAVKLQKVFWFSDCALFVRRNKPLTGATYVKGPYGPYSPQIEKSIQRLLKSNRLAEKKIGGQRQFFATERANVAQFDGDQIAQLDATIEQIVKNHSAASISEASHDRIWELAELGEDLPLSGVFAAQLAEPSIDDLNWAKKSVTPELLAWSEQELRKDR